MSLSPRPSTLRRFTVLSAGLCTLALGAGCGGGGPQLADFEQTTLPARLEVGDVAASVEAYFETPLGEQFRSMMLAEGGEEAERAMSMLAGMGAMAAELTDGEEGSLPLALALSYEASTEAADLQWELMGAGSGSRHHEGPVTYERGDGQIRVAMGTSPRAVAAAGTEHDVVLSWNAEALRSALGEHAPSDLRPVLAELPNGHYLLDVEDGGVAEHILIDRSVSDFGFRPVSESVVDDVPGGALVAVAAGLDVARLIEVSGPAGQEFVAQLAENLAETGTEADIDSLVEELSGTWALWVAPGAPFPKLGLQFPAGSGISELYAAQLAGQGMEAPAVGEALTMPKEVTGRLPVQIHVGRRETAWLITTDQRVAADWAAGESLDTDSGIGDLIAEAIDQEALILGVSDTPAVAETALGYLTFAESFLGPEGTESIREALRSLLDAERGSLVVRDIDGGGRATIRGQVPLGLFVPAIAMPNLLESEVAANEAAASSTLKSAIYSSMVTFQAAKYNDLDADGEGEYGFLPQLTGAALTFGTTGSDGVGIGELGLMREEMGQADVVPVSGYHYQVYLPDGQGGAMDFAAAQQALVGRDDVRWDDAERYFVAYAWPADPSAGRTVFAITQRGRVLAAPAESVQLPPVWHAAFGDPAGRSAGEIFSNPIW